MFSNCKNLNNVTIFVTDVSADYCRGYCLYEVASNGTFTQAAEMTSLPSGYVSFPSGWKAQVVGVLFEHLLQ